MLLYATGDSFTYGAELAEHPDRVVCYDHEYRERHAYPTRLAKYLGLEQSINEGMGGGSNTHMVRKAMTFLSQWIADGKSPSDVFVVIGWSMPRRIEFFYNQRIEEQKSEVKDIESGYIQYFPDCWNGPRWGKGYTAEVNDFFETYHKYFSWSGESNTRYAIYLLSMQSFLKQHGFPYLFFNSCWEARPEISESGIIFSLIDQTRFPGLQNKKESMNHWCTYAAKKKQQPRGHPNEAAHGVWAEHLAEYITSNNLLWPSSE